MPQKDMRFHLIRHMRMKSMKRCIDFPSASMRLFLLHFRYCINSREIPKESKDFYHIFMQMVRRFSQLNPFSKSKRISASFFSI